MGHILRYLPFLIHCVRSLGTSFRFCGSRYCSSGFSRCLQVMHCDSECQNAEVPLWILAIVTTGGTEQNFRERTYLCICWKHQAVKVHLPWSGSGAVLRALPVQNTDVLDNGKSKELKLLGNRGIFCSFGARCNVEQPSFHLLHIHLTTDGACLEGLAWIPFRLLPQRLIFPYNFVRVLSSFHWVSLPLHPHVTGMIWSHG